MIIPYGWFTSRIYSKRPKEIVCFDCGQKGQMEVEKFVVTPSVFYVPLLPISIYSEVFCISCNTSLRFSEMDEKLRIQYKEYKPRKFPPIWSFSGVLLVLFVFLGIFISDLKDRYTNLKRFEKAEVGRVIEYKMENNHYSAMKICAFNDTMAFVVKDLYEVDSYRHINKILDDYHFSNDTVQLEIGEIKDWIYSGKVKSVHW